MANQASIAPAKAGASVCLSEYVQNFARKHGIKPCEAVARIAGFSNYEQFRQARFAVENGTSELRHALNSGKVAIYNAYFLAHWPDDVQREISAQGKKDIVAWCKRLRMALAQERMEGQS